MVDSLAGEAKKILTELCVATRKKLGQNFMIDKGVLEQIASAVPLTPGEKVLEIGPGIGFLTRELLAKGAAVMAVEMDRAYCYFLPKYFSDRSFTVIEQDFLTFDIEKYFEGGRGKVFGNIPYNITSPILEKLIDSRKSVSDAVLTTQWEVAERIQASPGTKAWGPLSIFVQFYTEVKIIRRINRLAFSPAPKVDSAILQLHFYETPKIMVADEALFFQIVRKSFLKRRKTLLNSLEGDTDPFSKNHLREIFQKIGLDHNRRPETLSLQEWAILADAIGADLV